MLTKKELTKTDVIDMENDRPNIAFQRTGLSGTKVSMVWPKEDLEKFYSGYMDCSCKCDTDACKNDYEEEYAKEDRNTI